MMKRNGIIWSAAATLWVCQVMHAQGIITTIGGGEPPTGEPRAQVFSPASVAAERGGGFYLTDYNTSSVYKVGRNGDVIRIAGNGIAGFTGDNGRATRAQLGATLAVALDGSGNLFIADTNNNRIRRVDTGTHVVMSVAGNGTAGFAGDGGLAVNAEISSAALGGAVNRAGEIFIADAGNCVIRKVDVSGLISTVAGKTAGAGTNSNCGFGGDGGPAVNAQLNFPAAVAFDHTGNLFISDVNNNRIRRVDSLTGVITTVAGNGTSGFSGDGGPATGAAFSSPSNIVLDSSGNLFISDSGNARVRRVDHSTSQISTVAGNGTQGFAGDRGPAVLAELAFPSGLTLDAAGNLLIADIGNGRIRRLDFSTSFIGTVAGGGKAGDGLRAREAQLGLSAAFVTGLAVNSRGDLFFTDNNNNRIRLIDRESGVITAVAGDPHGALGFSGDGGLARNATMGFPGDIAADAAGNLFVEDFNSVRIRRIDAASGTITTVAGNGVSGFSGDGGPATNAALGSPEGVGVDAAGNLFIPDSNNSRIRRVDAATGIISTVAGNGNFAFSGDGAAATSAALNFPVATATDKAGNVFIVDIGNSRIREVFAATGTIATVAGSGAPGACAFSGDGGPAENAQLCAPSHAAVDSQGNLFIADTGNNRVRRVDHATHIITTVAGNGTQGFSGDGGPAAAAALDSPRGIAVDTRGVLFILDSGSDRIRKVQFDPPDNEE